MVCHRHLGSALSVLLRTGRSCASARHAGTARPRSDFARSAAQRAPTQRNKTANTTCPHVSRSDVFQFCLESFHHSHGLAQCKGLSASSTPCETALRAYHLPLCSIHLQDNDPTSSTWDPCATHNGLVAVCRKHWSCSGSHVLYRRARWPRRKHACCCAWPGSNLSPDPVALEDRWPEGHSVSTERSAERRPFELFEDGLLHEHQDSQMWCR